MSNSEQHSPIENIVNQIIVKSILKKQDFQSPQLRIDQAGNQIVKGGNHKITFKEETKETIHNKNYLISDSSDSDEEQLRNLSSSNTLEQVKMRTQPPVSQSSKCCTVF